MRRRLIVLAPVVLAAGIALPFAVDKVARLTGPRIGPGADPDIAETVAAEARFGAEMLNRGPARLIFPAHVVARVWREPGHCSDPNPGLPAADYRATVVALTWFGLPLGTIEVRCGGWVWTRGGLRPSGP